MCNAYFMPVTVETYIGLHVFNLEYPIIKINNVVKHFFLAPAVPGSRVAITDSALYYSHAAVWISKLSQKVLFIYTGCFFSSISPCNSAKGYINPT